MSETVTNEHDHDLYDDGTYQLFAQTTEGLTAVARYNDYEDKAAAEILDDLLRLDAAYAIYKANTPKFHDDCPLCATIAAFGVMSSWLEGPNANEKEAQWNADIPR